MKTVQELFFEARGVKVGRQPQVSRKALVDKASRLPGAPDLSEWDLQSIETGTRPPAGEKLRYLAAAAGLSLLDVLAAPPIDYWPEVGAGDSVQAGFIDLCERWGLEITNRVGRRFVVEVPE